jgi:iron complex outermembrane receptor protein
MKMTVFLLLAACLHVSAAGYAQQISLSVREAPLEKVFKEIQRQSGYSFWYKTRQLNNATKVTLDLKNATLEEALRKCFANQPLDYVIVEQTVVIRPREQAQADVPPFQVIKGRVTSADGKPLAGVSITFKSTRKGTVTNENGEFVLAVHHGDVLLISYVGYESQEITVGDQTSLELNLKESNASLNEIAVIGYGKTSHKNLTSAITTVKPE